MNITITSVHFKVPKIKEYAIKKVQKLAKYHFGIESINVRLISKKSHRGQEQDFWCEITVHVPRQVIEIIDSERAMDKAIDKAVERTKRALIKHKEKLISKKHKKGIINKFLQRFGKT